MTTAARRSQPVVSCPAGSWSFRGRSNPVIIRLSRGKKQHLSMATWREPSGLGPCQKCCERVLRHCDVSWGYATMICITERAAVWDQNSTIHVNVLQLQTGLSRTRSFVANVRGVCFAQWLGTAVDRSSSYTTWYKVLLVCFSGCGTPATVCLHEDERHMYAFESP